VIVFGNPVTFLSGLGTLTVMVGVLLYNKARNYEEIKKQLAINYKERHSTNV
jgi:solute carrier family 35 protein E2